MLQPAFLTLTDRTTVLGDVTNVKSRLANQHATVKIINPSTGEVLDPARPNNVPTEVALVATTKSGAPLTYHLRSGPSYSADSPHPEKTLAIDWRIFGSKGEIRIRSWDSYINTWSLNMTADQLRVEVSDYVTQQTTDLETLADEFSHLPIEARNIARVYEAFYAAWAGDEKAWYPDFEYASARHEILEQMYRENGM
jgi:hypothetical protein